VVWNLVPVTLGNLAGGFLFVALALFVTFARKPALTQQAAPLAQAAES
jgi:formate/nitrite transporter FocA (FNT family)